MSHTVVGTRVLLTPSHHVKTASMYVDWMLPSIIIINYQLDHLADIKIIESRLLHWHINQISAVHGYKISKSGNSVDSDSTASLSAVQCRAVKHMTFELSCSTSEESKLTMFMP